MRKGIVSELRMLRIVGFYYLTRHTCCLCNLVLLDPSKSRDTGGNHGYPIEDAFTEHHVDENHHNQSPENRVIVHRTCHKKYHITQRHQRSAKLKAGQGHQTVQKKLVTAFWKDDVVNAYLEAKISTHRPGVDHQTPIIGRATFDKLKQFGVVTKECRLTQIGREYINYRLKS